MQFVHRGLSVWLEDDLLQCNITYCIAECYTCVVCRRVSAGSEHTHNFRPKNPIEVDSGAQIFMMGLGMKRLNFFE